MRWLPPPAQSDGPELGTAHPLSNVVADPGARWVSFCQARQDTNRDGRINADPPSRSGTVADRLKLYLVFGSGSGEPIESFVAAAPSGDFLAFEKQGRFFLSTAEGVRTEIGKRFNTSLDIGVVSAPFSSSSKRFAYASTQRGHTVVIVRELESGKESEIDAGQGTVGYAELDHTGGWLKFLVYPKDTNGDGKAGVTTDRENGTGDFCNPGFVSDSVRTDSDASEARIARVGSDAVAHVVPGLIAPVSDWLLVRTEQGALVAQLADGSEDELVSSACDARVHSIDAESQRILVVCAAKGPKHGDVEIHGRDAHISLGVKAQPHDYPFTSGGERRLVLQSTLPSGRILIDLASGEWRSVLDPDHNIVGRFGSLMLVGEKLMSVDVTAGSARVFSAEARRIQASNPPYFATSSIMIDLARGGILGRVPREPLAVDNTGRVLLAQPRPSAYVMGSLLWGPLRWTALGGL